MRAFFQLGYLSSLGILSFVGFTHARLTDGLAAGGPNGPFYCNELKSVGGDDSVMVAVFVLFIIPLAVRTLRLSKPVNWFEAGLFWFVWSLGLLAMFFASLDCADVFYTAFGIPDLFLASALVALLTSGIALLWLRPSRR